MNPETALRESLCMHGESLYARGLSGGSTGNISARVADGFIASPTNSCLGRLDPARLSMLDRDGNHVSGDKPTKETFLHMAIYRARPDLAAVVHLHCTNAVAVSCLEGLNAADVLPPITPYFLMRIGTLPLVPYFTPGDPALGAAVAAVAPRHHAMLLANHGPVVAGKNLDAAVYAMEELEETAKLFLMLHGRPVRSLTPGQIADVKAKYGN